MSSAASAQNNFLCFQLGNDGTPATKISIQDGAKLAHIGTSADDVTVLLKQIVIATRPVQKLHFSIRVLNQREYHEVTTDPDLSRTLHPSPVTVGVISLPSSLLACKFNYADLFGHVFNSGEGSDTTLFRAADSLGNCWNGQAQKMSNSHTLRFGNGDLITLVLTLTGTGSPILASFAIAINGTIKYFFPSAFLSTLNQANADQACPFFFVQFSDVSLEIIGDITTAQSFVPNPARRLSLLAMNVYQDLVPYLSSNITTKATIPSVLMPPPGLGLSIPQATGAGLQWRTSPQMTFSVTPRQSMTELSPQYPQSASEEILTSGSTLSLRAIESTLIKSDSNFELIANTTELSNICGFGMRIGSKVICADESTVYAEVDPRHICQSQIQANGPRTVDHYKFSDQASNTNKQSTSKPPVSNFSIALFSINKSPGQPMTLVINNGRQDSKKTNVRLLCVHKKLLQVIPASALFPILLSHKENALKIAKLDCSGLYSFTLTDDGVELHSYTKGDVIKVNRLMLSSIKDAAFLFGDDLYKSMILAEESYVTMRVHGNRGAFNTAASADSLDVSIASYRLCIAVNKACVNILQPYDNYYQEAIRANNNVTINSAFSIDDLKPIETWLDDVRTHRNGHNFRFLRNSLGFMGFVDLSYRLATVDTSGMTMTTAIPVSQASPGKTSNILAVAGVSMPSGCNLQLVSYSFEKDLMNTNKNIAKDYYPSSSKESVRSYVSGQTLLQRELFNSQFIIAYEYIYGKLSKETGKDMTNLNLIIRNILKQLHDLGDVDHLVDSFLTKPDYLYNVLISRELDRVQSPVRSSVLKHICDHLCNDTKKVMEKTVSDAAKHKEAEDLYHTWNYLKYISDEGVPFWLFFDEIVKGKYTNNLARDTGTFWTNESPSFYGNEFQIVVHALGKRVLYVLYVNGLPEQALITSKPVHIMLTFGAPWCLVNNSYLNKTPEYYPNYLQLTYGKECFWEQLPFTPYLPAHLEMLPLTSSLNLEIGSPSKSSSDADVLELYNNAANKMTHWESLSFVGTNSLVTPQTTNLYINIFSRPTRAGSSILHEAMIKQYESKSPKTARAKYDETSYIILVASQYRQEVSNYVGIHRFANANALIAQSRHLDIFRKSLDQRYVQNPPPQSYVIDDISTYYKNKEEKTKLFNTLSITYYEESYAQHSNKRTVAYTEETLGDLREQVCEQDSYCLVLEDLRKLIGDLHSNPVVFYLCIGHCIDYTHMFNNIELFTRGNDMQTIVWNVLLLLFGGSFNYAPCNPVINKLVEKINNEIIDVETLQNPELFTTGNAGPIKRMFNPESLLDVPFPPNELRDEYRSFYNYSKLCYVYSNRVFETRYNETYDKARKSRQASQNFLPSVSVVPTCDPPPSVYVRFERIYVPPEGVSLGKLAESTGSVTLSDKDRATRALNELESVSAKVAKQSEPVFPLFEEISSSKTKRLYVARDRSDASGLVASIKNNALVDQKKECIVFNGGYAVDATNVKLCILLSSLLPTRPLYSHCLKIVMNFQGKYGRFMIDRYSSTFSCFRFATEERGKKKYLELSGLARVTIILDYRQMFIFIYLRNLSSDIPSHDQRVPWKINWPVRFMVLLEHASVQITTAEL